MTVIHRRGFTLVEALLLVAMASVLAAISLPRFHQAQKRAKQSEAITQLKSLHAAMSSQARMPKSIHVPGFDPPRGNRYSYHVGEPCGSYEDRSTASTVTNTADVCLAADTLAHPTFPRIFTPVQLPAATWLYTNAVHAGMGVSPGFFGTDTEWYYLAQAAGDLDKNPSDKADTWVVTSVLGQISSACPNTGSADLVPAGEPFRVNDDIGCD